MTRGVSDSVFILGSRRRLIGYGPLQFLCGVVVAGRRQKEARENAFVVNKCLFNRHPRDTRLGL